MQSMLRIIALFALLSTVMITSCVQPTYQRTVQFDVDMRDEQDFGFVAMVGEHEPLSWKESTKLSDPDGDGIYSVTLTFDLPYDFTECKFIIDDERYELKDQDNRRVEFNKEGTTQYQVKFDVP